ncbi:MAG: aspartate aminotransferase family protein [Verrucomicrobiales bacterium]|nr:aspartate aminotransferase family protein [Verrucomicrobiales bacterium]
MARRFGKSSAAHVFDLLQRYESRNVTFIERDRSWPIVWHRAKGAHVWDIAGRRYLDLTAAFGVAAAGHANPRVVRAGQRQMGRLLHAMGDVHPHALKAELARELSRITFERWDKSKFNVQSSRFKAGKRDLRSNEAWGKAIFCNSGFEAVEAALKTAMLGTSRAGVIAFHGAYHGLGYGALNVTHREHFRAALKQQLGGFGFFLPFPKAPADLESIETSLRQMFQAEKIGAVLVEPVQTRGGINIPPIEFLPLLRRICDEARALLICDEIYTGFGRTGRWFACEHSQTVPDLICLGKALTGGFPLSACVGRADLMDRAWPASNGEAIHTSTYLGHPVGCAMALAQIREIETRELNERSAVMGEFLLTQIQGVRTSGDLRSESRGLGLMAGIELRLAETQPAREICLALIKRLLHAGFILLPEGEHSNVISFTPPLVISKDQLARSIATLQRYLAKR